MTTAPDQCCHVCGDGVPLSGPEPETVWHVCRSCLAEGWTGEAGDDVRRYIGAGPAGPATTDTEIARIPQVDGSTRIVVAQDAEHARRAKALIAADPSWIDGLDGVDGIHVTIRDEPARSAKTRLRGSR